MNSAAHTKALGEIQAGIRMLTRGFRLLAKEIRKGAARGKASKREVSPGRRIQGRYIGLIRNLPIREKAKVRALRAKKGVEAAIRMALESRQPR